MDKQVENESKAEKVRHSRAGIASLFLALFTILYWVFWVYIFPADQTMDPGPAFIMIGCPMITSNMLGLSLAVYGLSRKDKIFSKLGIILNGIPLALIVGLILYISI